MPNIVLQNNKLDSLPAPTVGGKKIYYGDTKQPGLFLVAHHKGKSYYFRKQFRGIRYRVFIGEHPALHLDDARRAVAEAMAALARGERPQMATETMKVGELWQRYIKHAKETQKSWRTTADYYRLHVRNRWENIAINNIERNEVQEWLYSIGNKSGRHTANRSFQVLQSMLNWGRQQDVIVLKKYPTKGIKTYKMESRDRFLQPGEEYNRFMEALESCSQDMQDFVRLSLATGARKSNLLAMRWEDLHLNLRYWKIPGSEHKNKSAHNVHLSQGALDILKRRRKEQREKAFAGGGSQWVFPSDSKSGHMTWPGATFRRLVKRAGIRDLRIHDLRRTLGSYMSIKGVSLPIIGQALGHKDLRSTQIYARLNFEPIRNAVEAAYDLVNAVREADEQTEPATNILQLRLARIKSKEDQGCGPTSS